MDYISTSYFFDYEDPNIQHIIAEYRSLSSYKEMAVVLYRNIRDNG